MSSVTPAGGSLLQQSVAIASLVMGKNTQELATSLIHQTLAEMGRMAQAAAQAGGKGLHLDITV